MERPRLKQNSVWDAEAVLISVLPRLSPWCRRSSICEAPFAGRGGLGYSGSMQEVSKGTFIRLGEEHLYLVTRQGDEIGNPAGALAVRN